MTTQMTTAKDVRQRACVGAKMELIATNLDKHQSLGIVRTITARDKKGVRMGNPPFGTDLLWPADECFTILDADIFQLNVGKVHLRYAFR